MLIAVHRKLGLQQHIVCVCKQVTGEANETQICEALRRYSEREGFVREALFHLFSLTHVMEKPRPDILKVGPCYCTWKVCFLIPFRQNMVYLVCKKNILIIILYCCIMLTQ